MKECSICKKGFDPGGIGNDPAEQAGAFLAEALYDDTGDLCPTCLANRGMLGMMYCREFD